jgi:hypothetical protein
LGDFGRDSTMASPDFGIADPDLAGEGEHE